MKDFGGFERSYLIAVVIARVNKAAGTASLFTTRYWAPISDLPVKLVFSLPPQKEGGLSLGDMVTLSTVETVFTYTKYKKPRVMPVVGSEQEWRKFSVNKYDTVMGLISSNLVVAGLLSTQTDCGDSIMYGVDLVKGWCINKKKNFLVRK